MSELAAADEVFSNMAGARSLSFARMLSWEFSRPSVVVVRRKSTRKSSKTISNSCSTDEGSNSIASLSDESAETSDSSEYVTAEESPVSDEESIQVENEDRERIAAVECADATLSTSHTRRSGRSKKQKRKQNRLKREARLEFFSPFLEGFDDDAVEEASLAAAEHDTVVGRGVPSLSEFCVQKLWGTSSIRRQQLDAESGLKKPVFMDQMKSERRAHQLVASVQLKWLHKCVADLESREAKDSTASSQHYYDWTLQSTFSAQDDYSGLFTPLPHPDPACNMYDAVAALAHVADLMVPVVVRMKEYTAANSTDSEYRATAVWRLRSALFARYPKLTAKLLDDVIPYVWWARGDFQQAAELLVARSRALKDIDKNLSALYLNEAGRLYSQLGDRDMASKFFRLASETAPNYSNPSSGDMWSSRSDMVVMSALALSANTWDQGVLDVACGVQAGGTWRAVLLSDDIPSPVVIDAVVSRLSVHTGVVVGSSNPDEHKPVSVGCDAWLDECVTFVASLVEKTPRLYHWLSLLYALQGKWADARRSHQAYVNQFASFRTWSNGMPGAHRGIRLDHYPHLGVRVNPWESLMKLVKPGPPSLLRLVWRHQLSHPSMCTSREANRLAYHVSNSLSIRLSEEGNITVDAIAHHPPIRGLQLDTHTGMIRFPQCPGTTTPWMSLPSSASLTEGGTMIPVPICVLNNGKVQVEVLCANSESRGKRDYLKSENNLTLLYMTDCITKRRVKVDLRSPVRKKLKEVLLEKSDRDKANLFEERKRVIEHVFRRGWYCSWKENVKSANIPSASQAERTNGFHMQLRFFVTYGSATVALFFTVVPSQRGETSPDTIVIVDCRNIQSFKRPRVYGLDEESSPFAEPLNGDVGQKVEFRYSKILVCNRLRTDIIVIFNESGDHIVEFHMSDYWPERLMFTAVIGDRLYGVTSSSSNIVGCVCVESDEPPVVMESEPLPTVLSVKSAGHDLLVLTTNGLYVLNPDSLASFPIRSSTDGTVGDMTGSQVAVPGKFVQWEIFETTERGETTLTALALDYTFVLLAVNRSSSNSHTSVQVSCSVELPGVPSEVIILPGDRGVLLTTGLFMSHDPDFTEQLLWLSMSGELKGILPVLGRGPHSFFPLTLYPRSDAKSVQLGLHVYFSDGRKGICCMAL